MRLNKCGIPPGANGTPKRYISDIFKWYLKMWKSNNYDIFHRDLLDFEDELLKEERFTPHQLNVEEYISPILSV